MQRLNLTPLEDRSTPATFTVTTTADAGAGTFRQAILDANAAAGMDTINFAIPGGGVQTITPATALPDITDATVVDASTQPGFTANVPTIRLRGTAAGVGANGLTIRGGMVTVRGFAIGGFTGAGVRVDGTAMTRLIGNFIGTDANGTAADANGVGVVLTNSTAAGTIGGTGTERNVISGNATDGIRIDANANQNTISGNFIGTDRTGVLALRNGGNGIALGTGARNNLIGGATPGTGNVIAANGANGIRLTEPTSSQNTIAGNAIGQSFAGSPLGNTGDGVRFEAGAGSQPMGGATANTPNILRANSIQSNGGAGVSVRDSSRFVRIEGTNSFFDNAGLGISIDATANNGLAAPVVKAAAPGATGVQVSGTIVGQPNTTYAVNVYSSSTADPSGVGEGKNPVGSPSVTTAADGTATFALTTTGTPTGKFITATATAVPAGDTSAFSNAVATTASAFAGRVYAVGAGAGRAGVVNVYQADGTVAYALTPFGDGFTGGVRVATADFNGDGTPDVVVGTGPGVPTQVFIIDGATKSTLFNVNPFEASFTGGVYVAAGDLNGDGKADLVITPDEGGGPRVDVYSGAGFGKLASFFGIDDPNFRGGARPAVGDITGDGNADLIVAAGFGGGPRVAGFKGNTIAGGTPVRAFADFFAFEQGLRNGVFVAVADVNGDGTGDLIAGGGPGGGPRVTVFAGSDLVAGKYTFLANFFAGDANDRGGVRVAAKDLTGDGRAEVITGSGTGAGSKVNTYAGADLVAGSAPTARTSVDAFAGFTGGVFVG